MHEVVFHIDQVQAVSNLCNLVCFFILFQSTYCSTMVRHSESINRSVQVVNLDPAAEHFDYPVLAGKHSMFKSTRIIRSHLMTGCT